MYIPTRTRSPLKGKKYIKKQEEKNNKEEQ
jgi:hypothetical protein